MKTYFTENSYIDIPNLTAMMNWDDKKKIYLINILSNSLLTGRKTPNITEEEYTMQMINRFAGAWNGEETAEEIIANIKEAGGIRQPLEM